MKKFGIYLIVLICGALVFLLQFDYGKKYNPYTYYQVYLDDEKIGVIRSKDEFDKYVDAQGDVIKKQVSDYNVDIKIISAVYDIMKNNIKQGNPLYNDYIEIVRLQDIYNKLNKLVDSDGNIIKNSEEAIKLYNSFNNNYTYNSSITNDKINNYSNLKNNIDKYIMDKQNNIINYIYSNRDKLVITTSQSSYLDDYKNNKLNNITYTKYVYMVEFSDDNEIYMHTNNVYEPLGINIKKLVTYNKDFESAKSVYDRIIDKKPCTIRGYQFKIKKNNTIYLDEKVMLGGLSLTNYEIVGNNVTDDLVVYVTEPEIFNGAIDEITRVFVGGEEYNLYQSDKQKEIESTGSKIENVYLREELTIKETNISVREKIFNNSSDLASFLLYGDTIETSTVYASSDESISTLAYENGISIEEFFLSNPTFTSIDNMLYDGQPITITKLKPQLSLVVEEYQVVDKSIDYQVVEEYDDTMIIGSEKVKQEGSKGTMRVYQTVHKVNGSISYVDMESQQTLKNATNKIILVGTKEVPNVGSLSSWGWPTKSGYTITSYFGWRAYPFNPSRREFHAGIDIAGTGYGSPIYATNNGTVVSIKSERWNYGNSVIIDHNNGYWSNYGHLKGFAKGLKVGDTVARGQIIGYMGKSGAATGTHLHFEIRKDKNKYSAVVNPLPYLRK